MYRMKAKEFLAANPLLYSNLEKYIWISDSYEDHRNAQLMFHYLLKKKVYANGFATNAESLFGLEMYNKRIVDVTSLNKELSVVFYDPYFRVSDIGKPVKGQKLRILNPDMDTEYVVIWGSGITGETVYQILSDNGVRVQCFVDSREKPAGTMKCGLPVYTPERLGELADKVTIVEAMEKWELLDESIRGTYRNRFHYSLESISIQNGITYVDDGVQKSVFSLADFWMFHLFTDKRVYIYGKSNIEKEFAQYLKLMDYSFAGFLVDMEFNENGDAESDVWQVEEILYEENYFIWISDKKRVKKLKELGFKYFENYICNGYYWDLSLEKKNLLDVNLGYNYLVGSKYPGIVVYGSEEKEDYKIAVLGGSTTDGMMYPFKSWPQLLYEELGDGITIYNGGIGGYASGQELIKLIRDILPLKPDMILVYDGYNEFGTDVQYPFFSSYAKMVFDYAREHIDNDFMDGNRNPVCTGAIARENRFNNWMSNIRTMYAIASERNIKFYSFCQPCLSSKEGKNVQEKNILLSIQSGRRRTMLNESFRTHMAQIPGLPDYMHDLSHIFDGENDIYMDICHVWEKGNRIIAEEIKKIICSGSKGEIMRN